MPNHECVIIANPEGNAWGFASSIYEDLSARDKKFKLNELHVKKFRDGETKVRIEDNIRRANCFFIHDSSLHPDEWKTQLHFANHAMKFSSANEIVDVLPYHKFLRQDRKDESRVGVNAKAVADMIGLYADRVLTIDAHFEQIQGFYDIPVDNLYSSITLSEYLKEKHSELLENVVVMSPDVGGTTRARGFANRLGVKDIVIGYKHRPKAGELSDDYKIVGEVAGKDVLLIDDIVDSGSTLITAAKTAKENGAKEVYSYCTHGIFSEGAREKMSEELDLVIVSDSIPQLPYPSIEILPLAKLFAESIYRTNEGESLSDLFR